MFSSSSPCCQWSFPPLLIVRSIKGGERERENSTVRRRQKATSLAKSPFGHCRSSILCSASLQRKRLFWRLGADEAVSRGRGTRGLGSSSRGWKPRDPPVHDRDSSLGLTDNEAIHSLSLSPLLPWRQHNYLSLVVIQRKWIHSTWTIFPSLFSYSSLFFFFVCRLYLFLWFSSCLLVRL